MLTPSKNFCEEFVPLPPGDFDLIVRTAPDLAFAGENQPGIDLGRFALRPAHKAVRIEVRAVAYRTIRLSHPRVQAFRLQFLAEGERAGEPLRFDLLRNLVRKPEGGRVLFFRLGEETRVVGTVCIEKLQKFGKVFLRLPRKAHDKGGANRNAGYLRAERLNQFFNLRPRGAAPHSL